MCWPGVKTYDLWVDADKNTRYVARKVRKNVALRSQPLVLIVEFHELAHGRSEYTVPIDQPAPVPPGSSSEAAPEQGGWREGISHIEW